MKFRTVTLILFLSNIASATTWMASEKTDPLSGEKVPCQEIASYGSYIYEWPSKSDLVFWPLTDASWICMNTKNGYAAFNDDFESISGEEKERLENWLRQNYAPDKQPQSHAEILAWLEKVYGQREMNDDFWCRFYRLMAYILREDRQASLVYVNKTVPLLEKKLLSELAEVERIEVLYLLGEYHRRLGEIDKAEEFFAQVPTVKYKNKKGKEKTIYPYFVNLVKESRRLITEEFLEVPAMDGDE